MSVSFTSEKVHALQALQMGEQASLNHATAPSANERVNKYLWNEPPGPHLWGIKSYLVMYIDLEPHLSLPILGLKT